MVHSDLKNTIDLIKNINELQLNFNNQNLVFKQFIRNSKYITFTNQSGVDVNLLIDDINNKYKKKYNIDSENSVDTSIFNSNKNLKGGNDISLNSNNSMSKINNNLNNSLTSNLSNSLSTTSNSFISKLNNKLSDSLTSEVYSNTNLNGGNINDMNSSSNTLSKLNDKLNVTLTNEEYSYKNLNSDNFNDVSATSNSFMSKFNNKINYSLTSDSSNLSMTSNSFMSKINNNNLTDSLTSNTLVGGNINDSNLSLDEASVFEDSVLQAGGFIKNNIINSVNLEENSVFEDSITQKGGYEEDIKSIISINLDDFKINKSDKDSVSYKSNSTLNSLSEINANSEISDSKILNKILKQNGGGSNFVNTGFRTYNINSSSTSSICE